MNIEGKEKGILVGKIRIGKEKWRVVGVYVRKNEMEGKQIIQ